ncbi:MAG: NAD-dependent succinate-semialdehyde dehydrogenase [Cyclobacteriaceae bacterium]|nr:NAD-dependent succinate-semialdehyde dehydrogenase [Cyclobacteriaceae bacterium]
MEFISINPYDQREVGRYRVNSRQEVAKKLDLCEKGFYEWSELSITSRSSFLNNVADILDSQNENLARLITLEMGKVIGESRAEVEKCAWVCRHYAENAEQYLADEILYTAAKKSFVRHDPLGCVFAIMPWNFPFWQVFRFAAPALMAGNVGLLKHAPNVCGCALAIAKIFTDAGIPEGAFQTVVLTNEQAAEVIAHPVVKAVTLTGSERAGKAVASLAGQHLKKTVLELGGSDPFIVLDDADIEKAARAACLSRMMNAGQSCIAAKRFIVMESVKEDFTAAFMTQMSNLTSGDPLAEDTRFAPLARRDLADNLMSQLKGSVDLGARMLTGGKRDGCFIQPTLITGVKPGMPAFDQETFGPLAAIIQVKDEKDALNMANRTIYGLGASVWSASEEKALHFSRKIEAGSVFINGLVKSDPRVPFGGIKNSGYGRELARHGIREFVNVKAVVVE